MKILFYLEPSLFHSNVFYNFNWGLNHIQLFSDLRKNDAEIHAKFICNSEFETRLKESEFEEFKGNEIEFASISNDELISCFGKAFDLVQYYYQFNSKKISVNKYKNLIKEKMLDFSPDVIIIFNTPASFLRQIYPDALMLHQEVGMFSRPPFPLVYFMDPYGQYDESYLSVFNKELSELKIEDIQKNKIIELRDLVHHKIFRDKDPFSYLPELLRPFKHKLLFPLQFHNFDDFLDDLGFTSQIDLLCTLLSSVGSEVGVVVTQHPNYKILKKEMVDFLKRQYPNFIYVSDFDNWYGASQFIIQHVDAVFSVYSSLALQALFFEKKLFSIGSSGLAKFADCNQIKDINDQWERETPCRLGLIFHLLKYCYIPKSYLNNGIWMKKLIEKMIYLKNNNKLGFQLAGPIMEMEDDELILFYKNSIIFENMPSHVPDWDGIEILKDDPCYHKFYDNMLSLKDKNIDLDGRIRGLIKEKDELLQRVSAVNTECHVKVENTITSFNRKIEEMSSQFEIEKKLLIESHNDDREKIVSSYDEKIRNIVIDFENQVYKLTVNLNEVVENHKAIQHTLECVLASNSWKITKPMRLLMTFLKSLKIRKIA